MRSGRKSEAQTPSPKKDRIKGSKVNPKGSASSAKSAKSIELSDSIITTLENKRDEYNKKHPNGKVTLGALKAVFRRGAGAFSSSHRPGMSRSGWAFARVNKFLLKKGGTKVKAAYVQDDDLMEKGGILDSSCKTYISQNISILKTGYYLNLNEFSSMIDPYGQIPLNLNYTLVTYNSGNQDRLSLIDTINPINLQNELADILNIPLNNAQVVVGLYIEMGKKLKSISQIEGDNILVIDRDKIVCKSGKDDDLMERGGLIAPNGKKSNLTDKQYKLVRTPEFKAWFGDWENDPENASKVVDENGEPMLCYHVTNNQFSIFDKKKSKEGFFFSANKDRLKAYGKKRILEVFLNIKNPSNDEFDRIGYDGIMEFGQKHTKNAFDLYEIIAFKPNQIKLADGSNTTFDAENPDIRYEDGGELGQEIICRGCGWSWNTNQSDASDKYICHKCLFDNRTFYDSDPIGLADGGYTYPYIPSHLSRVYNSRLKIPNVRGGWTKEKIIKYLKDNSSDTISTFRLTKYISEFDDWEQFKNHIYYHGTQGYIEKGLKPSITMSEREVERIGGGGYGQRYFGVSLTKRKRTAESFSGMSSGVTIYPVILKRDANVIERTDLKDSSEIDDIIVELYEKGIDAVWIGGGEEELVIINPYSILLYKYGKEYHSVYGGFKSIPLTDEEVKKIYNNSKILWAKYSEEYKSKQNQEEKQIFLKSLPNIQFEKGGLIAPNGKPSKLTLEQYKLVRTPEFKAWFGDWENDPENASKVVDENGEPLVVYHGTNSEINEFMPYSIDYYYEYGEPKTEKIFRGDESITEFKNKSKERGWRFIEPNFWFSKNNAYTNTKIQYKCFLKIIHLKKQIDDIVIKRTEKELFIENFGVEVVWSEDTERYYCVFESNQIKLADGTNTIFDTDNPDIRYEEGGQLKKPHTIIEIAEKHKIKVSEVVKALIKGQKQEREHTKDDKIAKIIAKHHLWESPLYYEKLKEMEETFEDGGNFVLDEIALPDTYANIQTLKRVLSNQGYEIVKSVKNQGIFETGGMVVGKSHQEADENGTGEKFKLKSTGQIVELEGGEAVIVGKAIDSEDKISFDGQERTPREIASYLNHAYGGVKFEKGGHITCGCSQKKYYHGGELPSAVVNSLHGGEAVITKKTMESKDRYEYEGEKLTPRQILSRINHRYGGVSFAKGGKLTKFTNNPINIASKMIYFVNNMIYE